MGVGAKRKCEGATLYADRAMVRDVPHFKQAFQMGRLDAVRGSDSGEGRATLQAGFANGKARRRARARRREARQSLQPGDVRSSLRRVAAGEGTKRDEVCSHVRSSLRRGAPGEGAEAMFSSARVGVGVGAEDCSSINFGRPGALLGSSVAFGSGCG